MQTVQKIADVTRLDLNLLDNDQKLIINAKPPSTNINNISSSDDQQLLNLYHQLDVEDRAEIRGEMKGMLRADKYKSKIKDESVG